MDITTTTIIKTAEATTANAFYILESTITNNRLVKVQASIFTLPTTGYAEKTHLGYIISENDNIHCSLPENASYALLFADFELFMGLVRDEINQPKETQQPSEK